MKQQLLSSLVISTILVSGSVLAEQLELSVLLGEMYSSDLATVNGADINVDSAGHIAVAIAWQESTDGEGQILLSHVKHNFSHEDKINHSLNIIYAHFNGIALFRQQNYTTTMSLGFGGAYFDGKTGDKISILLPASP